LERFKLGSTGDETEESVRNRKLADSGDEGESAQRRFYDFTRQFMLESARERAKEMYVFALVMLTAAWPVGYMIYSVIKLLLRGRPLD
jgi:hypothetical protein